MLHDFTELYKIEGETKNRIYSAQAVQFINHASRNKAKDGDCYKMRTRTATNKPFRIYDSLDSNSYRLGYQYGEKIWFDAPEEVEEYRQQQKELARQRKFERIEELKREIERLQRELEE